jgi:ribosome maturation factor RimP
MINNQEQIRNKIEEILKDRNIDLVEFKLFQTGKRQVVRCLIDYPAGGITIDECANVNKSICLYLEDSGLLGDNYVVEVNSPGLDRKLKDYKDFLKIKGKIVSLWFDQPFEGKEYLEGELVDINEEELFVKSKEDIFKIKLEQIKTGKEKII